MKITQSSAVVDFGGEGFSKDAVAFSLKTLDGITHQFAMKVEDVPFFVAGTVTLTRQSKELNGPLAEPEAGESTEKLRTMQSTGIVATAGEAPGEVMLVVHTGGFPMKFSTTAEAMFDLVADLERLGVARRS